jgi:hypothetical protein
MSPTWISGNSITFCPYGPFITWLILIWALILFLRFIPFSGGPRKCVGDQFALLEAIVALAIVLQKVDIQLVPGQKINMTTGATIHTTNVRSVLCIFFLISLILFMVSGVQYVHIEP